MGAEHPPVTVPDTLLCAGDRDTIDVFENDVNDDGPYALRTRALEPLTTPRHGTVRVLDRRGRLEYTPEPGYHGVDTFTYYASDSSDVSAGHVRVLVGDSARVSVAGPSRAVADASRATVTVGPDGRSISVSAPAGSIVDLCGRKVDVAAAGWSRAASVGVLVAGSARCRLSIGR